MRRRNTHRLGEINVTCGSLTMSIAPSAGHPRSVASTPILSTTRRRLETKPTDEKLLSLSLLFIALLLNGAGLFPELGITRVDLNDNVLHFPLIQGVVQAIEHGRNPFDWWAPEWSLGYPVLRTYQPLPHAMVALAYFGLFKSVSLMTVFVWVRYLSVALLPLTFFVTARLLSFSSLTAAAAAMLAPLISTPALYGVEYGSYLWAGSGLFTQAIACHFLLLTVGFAYQAVRRGRHLAITGGLLGLTFLAHFIYGYMAALTICLLAMIPRAETPLWIRLGRTAWMGAIALVLAAFQLVPMLLDGRMINHSRWEPVWKWDSFGAAAGLKYLFTGELLDHGRLPVLSLLALTGVVLWIRDLRGHRFKYPARTFVVLAAILWILLFLGRPFWGPVLTILGVSPDMQLHRVVGGAHVFLIFIAAIGLAGMWRILTRRAHVAIAGLVTVILFYPMVRERAQYLGNNAQWGRTSLAAYTANRSSINAAITISQNRGGRAFAGLPLTWGGSFKIGDPPIYAYLSQAGVPAVSFMFHSMSLSSEIMTRFNDGRAGHYRLFNIHTVVAPQSVSLAPFLLPLEQAGPLRILAAPESTDFDVVDAFYAIRTTKENFYDVNDPWLQSSWVENRQHLLLDMDGRLPPQIPRLALGDPLPAPPPFPFAGTIIAAGKSADTYHAEIQAARSSYVLFKMTWHPNWKASVDGMPVQTVMLSPGFVGVPVTGGRHLVECRYQPERWKAILAIAGFLLVGLAIAGERRAWVPHFEVAAGFIGRPWPRPAVIASGLFILALPVCIALFTSKLSNGHDATEYLPRMVEFHANIAQGILLPRWAPDLSRGTGQPLFLFNPPFFYYLAELWHLLGLDFVTSINLACVVIVLGSAGAMFLLGQLYFGDLGGWLAAAALLYAPYFSVNLYVRSALAEFAAFPFYALALYGFGAYAKSRDRRFLLMGAAAFAGVLLCHNPAALLFSPLLGAFIVFTAWLAKSWKILREQIYGVMLALGLSAFVWFPSLAGNQNVQVQSLLDGYSRYVNHFVYFHQLFYSPWGYGLSVAGDQDGMSFELGWSHLLLIALMGILAYRSRRIDSLWIWFFGVAAAILCGLMLPEAQPVWNQIRLLQYTAFPWRWLGPIAVCIAMVVAALGPMIESMRRWRMAAFAGAMALLIVPNLSHLHPREFRDIDLTFWSPKEIATRGIEVASLGEYRPRWMKSWPTYDPRAGEIVSGYAQIRQTGRDPQLWAGVIKAQSPAVVEMSMAYFPGWRVKIDNAPNESWPSEPTGLIRFAVSPGEHPVAIVWTRTTALWWSDGLSLLSLAALTLASAKTWSGVPEKGYG